MVLIGVLRSELLQSYLAINVTGLGQFGENFYLISTLTLKSYILVPLAS